MLNFLNFSKNRPKSHWEAFHDAMIAIRRTKEARWEEIKSGPHFILGFDHAVCGWTQSGAPVLSMKIMGECMEMMIDQGRDVNRQWRKVTDESAARSKAFHANGTE